MGQGLDRELSRRRFLGYVIAAPTVLAAADLRTEQALGAGIASPQLTDHYDLSDLLTESTMPTAHLITVGVDADGMVSFALPRAEVGQGITTAVAMTIADEMDVPIEQVRITLADARPELVWNQFTGGSNSMHSIYTPVRVAAAIARGQLLAAAGHLLDQPPVDLTISNGVVKAPGGLTATLDQLTHLAAVSR